MIYPTKNNVLLLIHGNSLVDSSIYHRTITNNGVEIDTTQKHFSKYGSLRFSNGSKSFSVQNLINGTMDYTIDFWYLQSGGGNGVFYSHGGSNSESGVFSIGNTFANWYANGIRIQLSFNINDWKHFACVRKNGITKIYINGVEKGATNYNPSFSTSSIERFGWNDSSIFEYFNGYIQELRICNVALWDSNFIPPEEPFELLNVGGYINPTNTGLINGLGEYYTGQSVDIQAIANQGYEFVNWLLKGYTRLEYIESNGTQYIDTLLYPPQFDECELEFQFVELPTTVVNIEGVRENNNGAYSYIRIGTNKNIEPYFNNFVDTNVIINLQNKYKVKTYALNNVERVYVNDELKATGSLNVLKTNTRTTYLFALHDTNGAAYSGKIKLYSAKYSYNNILVRDYIPVIRHSDGAIGLLDLVNLKFYGNSGTGTFIGGQPL